MAVGTRLCHPPAMLTLLLLSLPIFSPPPPSGVVVPIPDGARPLSALWSPDGRGVAICDAWGAVVVGIDGTQTRVLEDRASCRNIAFDEAGLVIEASRRWRWDGLFLETLEPGPPAPPAVWGDLPVVAQGPVLDAHIVYGALVFRPTEPPPARRGLRPVADLVAVGDHLFAASHTGVTVVNLSSGRVERVLSICDGPKRLQVTATGTLWLLCPEALVELRPAEVVPEAPIASLTLRRFTLPSRGLDLALTAAGQPAALTLTGLHTLDPSTGTFTSRAIPARGQLLIGPDGQVVVRERTRLLSYDARGKEREISIPKDARWPASAAVFSGGLLWTTHPALVARSWPALAVVAQFDYALTHRLVALPDGGVLAHSESGAWRVSAKGLAWSGGGRDMDEVTYDPRRGALWEVGRDGRLSRRDLADGQRLRVLPPGQGMPMVHLAWAQDGALLAVDDQGGLWEWTSDYTVRSRRAEGKTTQVWMLPAGPRSLDSPQSFDDVRPTLQLGVRRRERLEIVSLETDRVLHTLPLPEALYQPRLSPDGRQVAAIDDEQLVVATIGGSGWKPTGLSSATSPQWWGQGLLVDVSERGTVYWRPGVPEVVVGPQRTAMPHPQGVVLADQAVWTFFDSALVPQGQVLGGEVRIHAASPDGRWLAVAEASSVVVWDLTTRTARARLTAWADGLWEVRLADGTHRQGRAAPADGYRISK